MEHEPTEPSGAPPDLDLIAADLADVETALARLEDGSSWTGDTPPGGPRPDGRTDPPTTRPTPDPS